MIENDARYRHLVESATDITYTHDLKGRILTVNAAGEKLLGYDRGEASWILEDNFEMIHALEYLGGKIYKRYRLYEREI